LPAVIDKKPSSYHYAYKEHTTEFCRMRVR